MAGEAGALDKRAPARRRPGLAREARARLKVAANAVRLAGFDATAPAIGLSLALLLWVVSLIRVDPRAMTDLGLVTVLPPTFFAGLVVLTASFAALVHRRPSSSPLLGAHALALIAFLHATPAIVYGTLRSAWAWKHLGIVEYIVRHDGVKANIDYLGIYHNWPSFFGFDALLSELAGLPNSIDVAIWWPVVFNVFTLGALLFLFSAVTRDKRIVWLGVWIFMIANWVGQDYFSPQAYSFFFYLLVIGAVLRWLRPGSEAPQAQATSPPEPAEGEAALRLRPRAWWEAQRRDQRWTPRVVVAFIALALVVIASSHALTSMMITVALAVLVVFKACRVRSLPIVSAAIVALWAALFASNFVGQEGLSIIKTVHLPWVQAEHNVSSVGDRSADQQLVAHASLVLMLAVAAVAALGAMRELRAGRRIDRILVALAGAPLLLLAGGDYGGEMLFRIFMFALPFASVLAAYALLPGARSSRGSWWPAIVTAVGCTTLAIGFMLTYYGQDNELYFTPQEVKASEYLYGNAPADALLIEGTSNYPRQFENYEKFKYVTLSQQPLRSQRKIIARPVSVLTDWMSDEGDNGAYLIITRSMKAEVSGHGVMPPRSLDRIQRALMRSPRFAVVYRIRGAVIFTLAPGQGSATA